MKQQSEFSIKIVTQRCEHASLLVNSVKNSINEENDEQCNIKRGLVVYIAFGKRKANQVDTEKFSQLNLDINFDEDSKIFLRFSKLAKTLLNFPILTLTQQGDGQKPQSLIQLIINENNIDRYGLMIVPQASLVCSTKNKGKQIHYGSQLSKKDAKHYYNLFLYSLIEEISKILKIGSFDKENPRNLKSNNSDKLIEPKMLFKSGEQAKQFSEYDHITGMPLLDSNNCPISKSRRKKLEKIMQKHLQKWSKASAEKVIDKNLIHNNAEGFENEVAKLNIEENFGENELEQSNGNNKTDHNCTKIDKTQNLKNFDFNFEPKLKLIQQSSKLDLVLGKFGNRQGLKISAEIGPFMHYFDDL